MAKSKVSDHCENFVLPCGRNLRYATYGAPLHGPHQQVLVYLHGWPTSRLEAKWLHVEAREQHIAVVAIDRPGFGGSTFNSRGTFDSFAEDVELLLRHLQLEQIIIMGTSGGAAFATAAAAHLPTGQVQRLMLLSPLAPTKGREEQLLKHTSGTQRRFFSTVKKKPWAARLQLSVGRKVIRIPFGSKLIQMMFAKVDRKALRTHAGHAAESKHAEREGLRQGVAGPLRDMQLYCSCSWDTPLENIRCPTLIWHGDEDRTTPTSMAQHYNGRIPHSKLKCVPHEGHLSLIFKHAADILNEVCGDVHVAP